MGKYSLNISSKVFSNLEKIKKSGKKIDFNKVISFLNEIEETPRLGIGKPEQLKHHNGEIWSRRVNQKDRFVYEIFENDLSITIIQVTGHYNDI